jgi:hypothetical protein
MFHLYFRTILYMIRSKDNEKKMKNAFIFPVIIRNADILRTHKTKQKSQMVMY